MTYNEADLKKAIALIKSGDTKTGGQLLHDLLKKDRNVETAWLWMAACVETDEDKRFCLREALRINPANLLTQKALAQLTPAVMMDQQAPIAPSTQQNMPIAAQPDQPPAAPPLYAVFSPDPSRPPSASEVAAAQRLREINDGKARTRNSRILAYILFGIGGVCILCVLAIAGGNALLQNFIAQSRKVEYQVEYLITNTDRSLVDAEYVDEAQDYQAVTIHRSPWRATFTMHGLSQAQVIAYHGAGTGTLTCELRVNGKLIAHNSTSAKNKAITCSGLVR